MRVILNGTAALALLASAMLGAPAIAVAEAESGAVSRVPWSGYWWQHQSGGLVGPLSKYDQVGGSQAAAWERANHVDVATEPWFGYCHAWSAASVMEAEPRAARPYRGVGFGVGDQKGLLAACHAADVANSYGDRFGDGNGSEDRSDLRPEELWRLLQLYVRGQQIPLVLDIEAGEQVWNYPVYQYEVDYDDAGDGWIAGTMTLVAADDNVAPDFVGTQSLVRRYAFRVRTQNGALVVGSGEWVGESAQDHPDFAWYPYVALAENPEVDLARVSEIFGSEIGRGSTPPTFDATGPVAGGTPATPHPVPTMPDANPEAPGTPTTPPNAVAATPTTPTLGAAAATPVSTTPAGAGAAGGVPPAIAETLDPYELVGLFLNRTSHFALDLGMDQGDGGKYRPGAPIGITVRSGAAGYLYVFDADKGGHLRLVFPTRPETLNRIEAGVDYRWPAIAQGPPLLQAHGQGQHNLKAIVMSLPLRITGTPLAPRTPSPAQKPRPAVTSTGPESIAAPPSTLAGMRRLLVEVGAKRQDVPRPLATRPPAWRAFAQDAAAYFVVRDEPGPPAGSTN